MVETLNKIASLELKQIAPELQSNGIDLVETPGDLRIVLDPYCQEAEVSVRWDIPADSLAYRPTGTACYGFC